MNAIHRSFSLTDARLHCGTQAALQLSAHWTLVPDRTGAGVFLEMQPEERAPYVEHALGQVLGLQRFTSLYRFSPFWVKPAVGIDNDAVQTETVWLLAQTGPSSYVMLVPLLDEQCRYALRSRDGALVVTVETGDPAIFCAGGVALFVSVGDDPYALTAAGAKAVQQHLKQGRLRKDKAQPEFVDFFGWCTWDAFYQEVSAEKVRAGLASFKRLGVPPQWMILDDGWQQWERCSGGEDRLQSLDANEKFGGTLADIVRTAKTEFGIQHFLVWHALMGYWGGLSSEHFANYGVRSVARSFGPGILEQEPRWNVHPWGGQIGVPSAQQFSAFYEAWHSRLAAQGVDGVKVDAQALLESVSAGQGGRVATAKTSRKALEDSVRRHFAGRLINCMSCGQEGAYLSCHSSLMRSSDDYFPDQPESHGFHLHVNAMVGVWFGEFMQPDWDMFHSAHPYGAFHAAARAISGGPVYVSDKVGMHDAEILRKLVLSDGSVLRADFPARPTLDTLFLDPTHMPVLLKIFNLNRDSGVVGLFNASQFDFPVHGTVGPDDVVGLSSACLYAVWEHHSDSLWTGGKGARSTLLLARGEFELVSFAPIAHGFAALGLADKFNSTGAITERRWEGRVCTVKLLDGGNFLGWAAQAPRTLLCDGYPLAFTHDARTGRLCAAVPLGGPRTLCLDWN